MMREKSRKVHNLDERPVMQTYRWVLIGSFAIFIGWDLVTGLLQSLEPRSYGSTWLSYSLLSFSAGLGQGLVAVYFLIAARALSAPLLEYIRHPESNPRPENVAQVERLTSWLNMTGAAMLTGTVGFLFLGAAASGWYRAENALPWYMTMLVLSFTRIAVSFCQVAPFPHDLSL